MNIARRAGVAGVALPAVPLESAFCMNDAWQRDLGSSWLVLGVGRKNGVNGLQVYNYRDGQKSSP